MTTKKRKLTAQDGFEPSKKAHMENIQPKSEVQDKKEDDGTLLIDNVRNKRKYLEALESIASRGDGAVSEFLATGGRVEDVLNQLDMHEKTKPAVVKVIFEAAEKFMLYAPTQFASELARVILMDHMRYVIMFLSPSETAVHNLAILRLLTAMIATGNEGSAKDLLVKLNFEHIYFEQLFSRRASDIRKTYIYFLLSFFIAHGPIVVKKFMDKGGKRISGIVQGLHEDPSETVLFVMGVFTDKIMSNQSLSRTSKMKIFNTVVLKKLSDLMKSEGGWTGSEDFSDKATVNDAVLNFLNQSLTSVRYGLIFVDDSVGNSGVNRNLLLLTLLQTMKSPWENEWHEKLVIRSLCKSPDQLRPFLNSLSLSSPRDSSSWFRIARFMQNLIKGIDLEPKVLDGNLNRKFLIATLCSVAFPEVMIRDVVKPALKSTLPVQKGGIDLLHDALIQAQLIISKTDEAGLMNSSIRTAVLQRYKDRVPPLDDVLSFWNSVKTEPSEEYMCKTAKILDFYLNFLRMECESVDSLLSDIQLLDESLETNKATLYFLKYQASFFTIKKQFDDQYIEILFNVALKTDDETIRHLATTTLYQIFGIQNGFTNRFVEFEIFIYVCRKMKQTYADIISILKSHSVNISDLNEEILELQTKEDSQGALPGRSRMIERFLDQIIDNNDDDITEIVQENKESIFSSQNAAKLEMSPLTLILLKNYKPDLPWITEYIKYLSYCHGNFEELSSIVNGFIKEEGPLKKHFNVLRFGALDDFDNEGLVQDVHSLSAFITTSKLSQIYRLQRSTDKESALLDHLQSLLLAHKAVRTSLLLEANLTLELFKPYSPKQKLSTQMILRVLKAHPDLVTQTQYKKNFASDMKESVGLALISPELLDECFKTFNYDAVQLDEMLQSLCIEKSYDRENWLLHFAQILNHFPKSGDLSEKKEVIREVIRTLIETPKCHHLLNYIIKFSETHFCFFLNELRLNDSVPRILQSNPIPTEFLSYLISSDISSSCKSFRKYIARDPDILSEHWKTLSPILISLIKQKSKKTFITETVIPALKTLMCESIQSNDESEVKDIFMAITSEYPDKNILGDILDDIIVTDDYIPNMSSTHCLLAMATDHIPYKVLATQILMPVLQMLSRKLKDPSGISLESMEECHSHFSKFLKLDLSKVMKYIIKHKESFWINTVRTFLKHGLKLDSESKGNFRGLYILSELIKASYAEGHEHLSTIYQMIHGHSNFIKLIFSEDFTLLRDDLLQFIQSILTLSPELVESEHIPLYLGAYGSTLSNADQCILSILNFHEKKHGFASLQPIVWGPFAVSRYSLGSSEKRKSLWKIPRVSEILGLIDADKMFESAVHFPIEMKLFFHDDGIVIDSKKYDPRFYLPLFSSLCSPQSYIDKHLKLLESGGLALVLSALSSKDEDMRGLGYTVLGRIFTQFEATKFAKEKQIWLHFLNMIRNGARERSSTKTQYLRIPSIVSVFLVRTLQILKNPLHCMYKQITHFLLAKPFLDLFSVPDFLSMFHSLANVKSERNSEESPRKWILCVIRDGLRDSLDHAILQKTNITRLILSFHSSILATNQEEIFDVLEACVRLKEGALELTGNQGLLVWCLRGRGSPRRLNRLLFATWRTLSQHDIASESALVQLILAIKGLMLAGQVEPTLLQVLAEVLQASDKRKVDVSYLFTREELLDILPSQSHELQKPSNRVLLSLK